MDAREVGCRFHEEIEYIERYVDLLRLKSTLHDEQVKELNRILRRVDLNSLPVRKYERLGKPYSVDEASILMDAIRLSKPDLYQTILGYEQRLDDIPSILINSPAADYVDRLGEWVEFMIAHLQDDADEVQIDRLLNDVMHEALAVENEQDEDDRIPPEALRALLLSAIEHAQHINVRQQLDAVVYAKQQFHELDVLARMAQPGTEINVLRQGFLLLMTAFDAAVFDIVRVALHARFFELIPMFGKQDKVTLEAIGAAGTFDSFREQVINDQLKKLYLKDVLHLLNSLGVECADIAAGDRFVDLVELVLRRNLHVHNRGIVDSRYLERDPITNKPKYNLYNLAINDLAPIDDAYLNQAMTRCRVCIDRLVNWAVNGA